MAKGMLMFDENGKPVIRHQNGVRVRLDEKLIKSSVVNSGIIMLVNISSSMKNKLGHVRASIAKFTDLVVGTHDFVSGASIGVAVFSEYAGPLVETTTNIEAIKLALNNVRPFGSGNNLADGFELACSMLLRHSNRTILLITEGEPDNKDDALKSVDQARLPNTEVWCIAIGQTDIEFLQKIATQERMVKHVSLANLEKTLLSLVDQLSLSWKIACKP